MNKPNTIEQDLNTVRFEYYEDTKGMTPKERVAYMKAQTAPVLKELGIQTVSAVDVSNERPSAQQL